MDGMFQRATSFNQAVPFDTSSVTNMQYMFYQCFSFNQVVAFNTSSVTTMFSMFFDAKSFNQAVPFDTSSVTTLEFMFGNAASFNQVVPFDTSSVVNMDGTFFGATSFYQVVLFVYPALCNRMLVNSSGVNMCAQDMSALNTDLVATCILVCDTCILPSFPQCSPCAGPPLDCGGVQKCSCETKKLALSYT